MNDVIHSLFRMYCIYGQLLCRVRDTNCWPYQFLIRSSIRFYKIRFDEFANKQDCE